MCPTKSSWIFFFKNMCVLKMGIRARKWIIWPLILLSCDKEGLGVSHCLVIHTLIYLNLQYGYRYILSTSLFSKLFSNVMSSLPASCCCSITKSYPTLGDTMDCSMPGHPVPHYLPEFAQFKSIPLAMPSNHLVLCHSLALSSIFPSIRVFSNESAAHIRFTASYSQVNVLLPQSYNQDR